MVQRLLKIERIQIDMFGSRKGFRISLNTLRDIGNMNKDSHDFAVDDHVKKLSAQTIPLLEENVRITCFMNRVQ